MPSTPPSAVSSAAKPSLTRRELIARTGAVAAAALVGPQLAASEAPASTPAKLKYCLNTSTIRGQEMGIVGEVDVAVKAGYDALEPWMRDIDKYVQEGGSLKDLKKRIEDGGLTVESAIGFAQWIVDDDDARAAGLEQARRDMDTLQQIGGVRIAAPPVGAHQTPGPDLMTAAIRYRALLDLGVKMGVIPQVEVWGFSKSLSRLGESVYVAIESAHPQACLLPDVYHLYKGGSEFTGLSLLDGNAIHVFHMNDYPATPERATISDADRVYPGDGVAPLKSILQTLRRVGFQGTLSLELFNRDYWKQDALTVARTGLEKMKAAVEASRS